MVTQSTTHNIRYHFSKNVNILFVGINPHPGSDARGVPFSNNKMFWYLLCDAGIIREERAYLKDDKNLKELYGKRFNPEYKLGFINLIDRPTRNAAQLRRNEEKQGVKKALRIIRKYKPKVVVFVGKVTYRTFSGLANVDYGWADDIYNSKAYVLHFPLRGKASVRIKELQEVRRGIGDGWHTQFQSLL